MKSVFLIILGILSGIVSFAQPLSGTYTIGGVSPNYASFTAAVAALNTNGVSGPVTFNVRNGTYTESVLLTAVSGSSATNRITFQSEMGDSSLVILTFAGTSSTFRTNNARYLKIKKITIRNTNISSYNDLLISNGSNITIENCMFSGSTASDAVSAIFMDSSLTVLNCRVINGTLGVSVSDNTSTPYTSNVLIQGCQISVSGEAISFDRVGECRIINNTILGGNYGILLYTTQVKEISYNVVRLAGAQRPFQVNNIFSLTGNWGRIYNNVFYSPISSAFTNYNNWLENVLRMKIFNNTFYSNNSIATQTTFLLNNSDSVELYNNIFFNAGNGYACTYASITDLDANNNIFYTNGTFLAPSVTNLAQLQAQYSTDQNSVIANPQFVSIPNNLTPTNSLIDGVAINQSWITNDLIGIIRHPQYPDPGAYEFSIQPNVNLGPDVIQCGGSITLQSANNGSYYLWSTGATTQNITVNSSGAYWVQVNNLAGTDRDTINITINPSPSLNLSGNTSICTGDSVLLTAISSAPNLSWAPSATLSSNSGASVSAFPATTTTYTVTATDANNCSTTQQVSVTVNQLPTVLAADADACTGQCAGLNASGALTYSWLPAAGLSNPGIGNPLCCATASTNYTVTGTDANGCSNTDAVQFTVFALPVAIASIDTSVCSGGSVMLSGSGGITCSWTPAGSLDNSSSCTPMASPLSNTAYALTVTDTNGCTNSDTLLVTVHPLPSLPVIVQNGSSLISSSISGNQWYLNGNPIVGATDTVYTPIVNGNYEVVVTDSNGCSSASGLYFFGSVVVNAGNVLNDFSVVYNSLSGELIYYSLIDKDVNIVVYDLSGREVRRENILGQYLEFRIDISDIPKGFYFITIQNDSKTKVEQILLN